MSGPGAGFPPTAANRGWIPGVGAGLAPAVTSRRRIAVRATAKTTCTPRSPTRFEPVNARGSSPEPALRPRLDRGERRLELVAHLRQLVLDPDRRPRDHRSPHHAAGLELL